MDKAWIKCGYDIHTLSIIYPSIQTTGAPKDVLIYVLSGRILWSHFSMVQEKVFSLSPKVPQTSASGGTRMPKLKVHLVDGNTVLEHYIGYTELYDHSFMSVCQLFLLEVAA